MRPVIVFGDGDVARSLLESFSRESIPTVLLYTKSSDYARYSRFAVKWIRLWTPLEHEYRAIDSILTDPGLPAGAMLLPCNDGPLSLVSRYRDALAARFVPCTPSWEILGRLLHKGELYREAERCGVPFPRTWQPRTQAELESMLPELTFPLLVKPCLTHLFFPAFRRKLIICENQADLFAVFEEVQRRAVDVMLCEIIPGPDSSIFHYRCYIDSKGRVTTEICTQKLRQFPPGFGVACYSRSVEMIPAVQEMSRSLLRHLGFTGLASVEFKLDPRDGGYKLIEVNARPVLVEGLLCKAGVNLPLTAYQDLMEGVSLQPATCRPGIYWQHNFLELVRLIHRRDLGLRDYGAGLWRRNVTCVSLFSDPGAYLIKARCYLKEYRSGLRPGVPNLPPA